MIFQYNILNILNDSGQKFELEIFDVAFVTLTFLPRNTNK